MSRLKALFTFKCPSCEKGNVFEKNGVLSFGKVKKQCSSCQHQFEREPGFFFGAMYVSYAMAVAELIAIFIIGQFFLSEPFDPKILIFLITGVFLFAPINYKFSRMIWMYLFTSNKQIRKD